MEPYWFEGDLGSNNSGYYELQAVLTHKGRSSNSGHYVAWVKYKGETWIECNDDDVNPIHVEDVMKLSGGGKSIPHLNLACLNFIPAFTLKVEYLLYTLSRSITKLRTFQAIGILHMSSCTVPENFRLTSKRPQKRRARKVAPMRKWKHKYLNFRFLIFKVYKIQCHDNCGKILLSSIFYPCNH